MGCWIAFVGNSMSYPLLEFPRFTPQTGGANAKVSAAAGCGCLTQFLRQLSIALFARESQHKSKGLKDPWVSAEKMNGVLWKRESAKINRSLFFFSVVVLFWWILRACEFLFSGQETSMSPFRFLQVNLSSLFLVPTSFGPLRLSLSIGLGNAVGALVGFGGLARWWARSPWTFAWKRH